MSEESARRDRRPADTSGVMGIAPQLLSDLELLDGLVIDTIRAQLGEDALTLVEGMTADARALRGGGLAGGRDAFAAGVSRLALDELELLGSVFTLRFLLFNAAEEQHRIRVLRRRDRDDAPPDGSLAAAVAELHRAGVTPDQVRALLARLYVMPVLTAHPTEARRRTVIDLLAQIGRGLDRLDDPRVGARARTLTVERLREIVLTLFTTEQARSRRPSPLDEVRAALNVFESTLYDATPRLYRELEDALARAWPGERFDVASFLRWGTWIGGDRDGNPNVTADVTRVAFGRQRRSILHRYMADVDALGRELSVSSRRSGPMDDLERSIALDQQRLPEVAARVRRRNAGELVGEKLWYVLARLEATLGHGEAGYPGPADFRADLELVDASLRGARLARLADGRLRDLRRRAEVFGFHLASLDLRQHSSVHERAVTELLRVGGAADYTVMSEEGRIALLSHLLERADVAAPLDRSGLSPETRELLATIDVVARARREQGPEACERYVISFTAKPSDVLEVLFLLRAARLAPDEIRPVPLFEQLEDLDRAGATVRRLLDLKPYTTAIRGELEVMIGYSDSSKQAGYVASQVALRRAQQELARVADEAGLVLTVFHGRGGAVGRGGGPASRAIRSQPHESLRGRLRVTEQGETIAARYGRAEIALRDLEQMVSAVLLGTAIDRRPTSQPERAAAEAILDRAASASRQAYDRLLEDKGRLARYALAATPIQEVAELPIASRPAARKAGLSFEDLRAIPWVFSWNQSRHGLPGWFGLGTALAELVAEVGAERLTALYREWPAFAALIDNAEVALIRADIDVAGQYAMLVEDDEDRSLYRAVRAEHERTVAGLLRVTGEPELLAGWPTLLHIVERRNPYVDVLSHVQIELLRRVTRLAAGDDVGASAERLRAALFITINGIAAGLQTAG